MEGFLSPLGPVAQKRNFEVLIGSQSTFVGKIKETRCGFLNEEKPQCLLIVTLPLRTRE